MRPSPHITAARLPLTLALMLALLAAHATEALARQRPTSRGQLTLRTIPRPRNTNTAGGVFGGWMLSQMDQAANAVGARLSRGRSRTLAMSQMSFHKPVKLGEVLSIYTQVERVGRSTMTVKVEAYKRHLYSKELQKVTEARFEVAATDRKGGSRRIPTRKPTLLGRLADGMAGVAHRLRRKRPGQQAGAATGEPAIRLQTKRGDADHSGNLQTGMLLSQMDLAGTTAATQRAGGRVVTVAVDRTRFHRPVKAGHEVSMHAQVKKVGRTSMEIQVDTWSRGPRGDAMTKVSEAMFKFVALDKQNKPTAVPTL